MTDKKTVLVVDDSTSNLLGLQKILEKENYRVLTTVDGMEALGFMMDDEVDVVLLDLMMPGISGFDVLGKMKEEERTASIPVIIISARSNSKDVKEALDNGAVDYIKKPLDIIELLARTKSAIRTKSMLLDAVRLKKLGEEVSHGHISNILKKADALAKELKKYESGSHEANESIQKYVTLTNEISTFVRSIG